MRLIRVSQSQRWWPRFLRDTQAAALLEFAIVVPLLFAFVFGIVDFGRYFFLYNNLSNAAREGARLAAVSPMSTAADITTTTAAVVSAVRGRINDKNSATANVQLVTVGTSPAQTVKVSITAYPFARAIPGLVPATLPTVRAEFRYEFQ
jgi:Flp pilus assembly protein TadG